MINIIWAVNASLGLKVSHQGYTPGLHLFTHLALSLIGMTIIGSMAGEQLQIIRAPVRQDQLAQDRHRLALNLALEGAPEPKATILERLGLLESLELLLIASSSGQQLHVRQVIVILQLNELFEDDLLGLEVTDSAKLLEALLQ